MAFRFGANQRWQTKRGPPQQPPDHRLDHVGHEHHVLIPTPRRDNFGTAAGLFDYDFRWHVGDRLTMVSNGIFDFFDEGQKICTVGGFLSRPPRGSLYAGFTVMEGPIDSKVLSLSYTYLDEPEMGVVVRHGDRLRSPRRVTPRTSA